MKKIEKTSLVKNRKNPKAIVSDSLALLAETAKSLVDKSQQEHSIQSGLAKSVTQSSTVPVSSGAKLPEIRAETQPQDFPHKIS